MAKTHLVLRAPLVAPNNPKVIVCCEIIFMKILGRQSCKKEW
jgi:hypothetical protein